MLDEIHVEANMNKTVSHIKARRPGKQEATHRAPGCSSVREEKSAVGGGREGKENR